METFTAVFLVRFWTKRSSLDYCHPLFGRVGSLDYGLPLMTVLLQYLSETHILFAIYFTSSDDYIQVDYYIHFSGDYMHTMALHIFNKGDVGYVLS